MLSPTQNAAISALESQLWRSANILRGPVSSAQYKDYILTFMFFKCLCERFTRLLEASELSEAYNACWSETETPFKLTQSAEQFEVLREMAVKYDLTFCIPPNAMLLKVSEYLNASQANNVGLIIDNTFESIRQLNRDLHIADSESFKAAAMLESICAKLPKFASTNEAVENALRKISTFYATEVNLPETQDFDYFGRIYEYLLAKFSEESGKGGRKGGEFYTPHEASVLLAEVCMQKYDTELRENTRDFEDLLADFRIYDPAMGSGGLLTTAAESFLERLNVTDYDELSDVKSLLQLRGQETNSGTVSLAAMNMLLRQHDSADLHIGDTLTKASVEHFRTKHKIIVANPPWGLKDYNATTMAEAILRNERFPYPLKGGADFHWIQHIISSLTEDGIGAVLLSLGSASSKSGSAIRKAIIEADQLSAVVILPPNIFYGTGLPGYAYVFERNKPEERRGRVLYANLQGLEQKNPNGTNPPNLITSEAINFIREALYSNREDEKRLKWITKDEISENDWSWSHLLYLKEELNIQSISSLVTSFQAEIKSSANLYQETLVQLNELDAFLVSLGGE
jgi:type I restriction enzyme M protein